MLVVALVLHNNMSAAFHVNECTGTACYTTVNSSESEYVGHMTLFMLQ